MHDVKTKQNLINCVEKKLLKTKNYYSDIHPIKIFTSERHVLVSISALLSMILTVLGLGSC